MHVCRVTGLILSRACILQMDIRDLLLALAVGIGYWELAILGTGYKRLASGDWPLAFGYSLLYGFRNARYVLISSQPVTKVFHRPILVRLVYANAEKRYQHTFICVYVGLIPAPAWLDHLDHDLSIQGQSHFLKTDRSTCTAL